MEVDIYTDGSAKPNPGKGGYGIVFVNGDRCRKYNGRGSTNPRKLLTSNEMELKAVLVALSIIDEYVSGYLNTKHPPGTKYNFTLMSDSEYVVSGVNGRMDTWKRNNWKNQSNKPVKNLAYWKEMNIAIKRLKYPIVFKWVNAHSGIKGNEMADKLASNAIKGKVAEHNSK